MWNFGNLNLNFEKEFDNWENLSKIKFRNSKKEIRLFSNVHNRDFRADFLNFWEFLKILIFERYFPRFMRTTGIEKEHKTRLILLKLDKTSLNRIRHRSKNFIRILILYFARQSNV